MTRATGPKRLLLIRHCQAEGQEPQAPLTPAGQQAAVALAACLAPQGIDRIVSSPFLRTRETILPLAQRLHLPVDIDPRLQERRLSGGWLPDWRRRLAASFADFDLCLAGGESNRAAMQRGVAAVAEILAGGSESAAVVTHGNLLALLLHHYTGRFGFDQWAALSCPDVYCIILDGANVAAARIWPGDNVDG